MSDNFDFNAALPSSFKAINHNKTDHERYRREQDEVNANFQARAVQRARNDRVANLRVWDERVPPRWQGASIGHLPEGPQEVFKKIIAEGGRSAYITGREGSGKTYAAYAFIRRMVGRGTLLPSGVRTYTEAEIVGHARGGFSGRDALQAILDDKKTSAIILDGVGFVDDYTDRDAIAVEQIIDRAYAEDLPLIVTGSIGPRDWANRFSESTDARLRELLRANVITLPDREPDPSF